SCQLPACPAGRRIAGRPLGSWNWALFVWSLGVAWSWELGVVRLFGSSAVGNWALFVWFLGVAELGIERCSFGFGSCGVGNWALFVWFLGVRRWGLSGGRLVFGSCGVGNWHCREQAPGLPEGRPGAATYRTIGVVMSV